MNSKEKSLENFIFHDQAFYNTFCREWEEITNKIRSAIEGTVIKPITSSERRSSSSLVFK